MEIAQSSNPTSVFFFFLFIFRKDASNREFEDSGKVAIELNHCKKPEPVKKKKTQFKIQNSLSRCPVSG